MNKEEFLNLLKECLKDGSIRLNHSKATSYYDYDMLIVTIDGDNIEIPI